MTRYTVFFLLLSLTAGAQDNASCAALHNGIFHYYPKNSSVHLYCLRQGDLQYENEDTNTDTTVWRINWTSDCTYTEQYVSGSHTLTDKQRTFLSKHLLAYKIVSVTDDYYVAKEYLNKVSGLYMETDTLWFSEKLNPVNNELFERISNAAVQTAHLSDSSGYAILYVYRPGKLSNSLGNYPLYFNDLLLCIARNKSGYVFKVKKEGLFTLGSRLYKDASSVQLNIRFGNIYYVKSMIHWGISSRLYNFKLETVQMDPGQGKQEFTEVQLR